MFNKKEWSRIYWKENKERIGKVSKKWHRKNKEKFREYSRKWRENHPEKAKESIKKWCENNREYILKRAKQYRKKNRDKILKDLREYYENNKEKELKRRKEYRLKNKGRILEYDKKHYKENRDRILEDIKKYYKTKNGKASRQRSDSKRRTILKNIINTLTSQEWLDILESYNYKCAYCGCDFDENTLPTKDHIIAITRGGDNVKENIVPACRSCNARKGNKIIPIGGLLNK